MTIGPITIRWTKDVVNEADKRAYGKAVAAKVLEGVMFRNLQYKVLIERWGIQEGVVRTAKTPKGAGASV